MKSVASSAAAFVAIFTFALLLPRCNAMLDIDAEPNLVAADSGTADSAPNDGGDDSAPDDGGDGDDAVGRAEIVIAYNPWLASKLNAIVAQTLLQSQLDLSRKALALGRPSDRRCGVPEIERIQMDLRMAR